MTVSIVQALVLGIVQGITEFIPVSSSGHLLLIPYVFGWEVQSQAFDAALHLGTLVAVLFSFWRRLWEMVRSRYSWMVLFVGTLPAVLVGLLFDGFIEFYLRSPFVVGINLILVGGVMYFSEKTSSQEKSEREITIKDALVIGIAQVFALIPGVSRSGITISAGLVRSLRVGDAAAFSFILGVPVIAGAGMLKVLELVSKSSFGLADATSLGIGTLVAAVTGVIVIRFFLRFLERHTLQVFVWYRVALGMLILLLLL